MAGHVPKKTMIVIGPTGVGKSTFCNVIAGKDPMDQSIFPVSDSGQSVTNKTSGTEIEWRGSGGFPVTLIDTPGLSDSSEDDFKNISGMLKELEKHSEIHVFVLTVNGTQLTFSRYFKDMILIFQLCYGPQFLNKNTIIEVTHWSFDDANIKRRKIDEKTLKQTINEELKKVIPKLQDQLEVIFVDAMHNTSYESKHDKEKTKFKAEMDKLESFVTSIEPYSCNHEEFPGVNGLLQTIHSNNERKEKEKNEEIEKLHHENEQLKKEKEHMQSTGRRIKIESIVQLVSIIIALILVITLFQFPFLNGQWSWSDIYPQYIILSCILMFGLGALIFLIIKLCQTKDVNICGQIDMENATKNGQENCEMSTLPNR